MGKDDSCVDAETKLYIEESNKEQTKTFQTTLKDFGTDLKEWMQAQFYPVNKDIDHLRGDTNRLRSDVADLYNKDRDMRDRVGVLEQRQSTDEGTAIGLDKATSATTNKANITWVIIGVVSGLLVGVGGIIIGVIFRGG